MTGPRGRVRADLELDWHMPWLQPIDIAAGLHLVAWMLAHLDEIAVVGAARRVGVGLDAVGPYRITNPGPGGLIFGYATVNEQPIAGGIDRLAMVLGDLGGWLT